MFESTDILDNSFVSILLRQHDLGIISIIYTFVDVNITILSDLYVFLGYSCPS